MCATFAQAGSAAELHITDRTIKYFSTRLALLNLDVVQIIYKHTNDVCVNGQCTLISLAFVVTEM